jgi:hypothetical protein
LTAAAKERERQKNLPTQRSLFCFVLPAARYALI